MRFSQALIKGVSLGQFNKSSIRIAFGLYAYPMLVLAYLVSTSCSQIHAAFDG